MDNITIFNQNSNNNIFCIDENNNNNRIINNIIIFIVIEITIITTMIMLENKCSDSDNVAWSIYIIHMCAQKEKNMIRLLAMSPSISIK